MANNRVCFCIFTKIGLWHDIETRNKVPSIVNVVVEIPKGSQNKYEYDKVNNMMKLDRFLFSPLHYPGDCG
jgi:inorganic pyrophosphatase